MELGRTNFGFFIQDFSRTEDWNAFSNKCINLFSTRKHVRFFFSLVFLSGICFGATLGMQKNCRMEG
ncbi:hypothetical protein MPTK1_2g22990 [Marchantia polymorpha subsp. ruderalis]|uniref:Uncharacterized protein n=1 Tax=Marchantia polymorpha TaxID=3197 RepID=A0A2R6WN64_MARPO|nr:hypothetical protein MARPO_0072s0032 [Marchantia polymorpha]BBN03375.1 hypothetical protein Mp_2g22990 [Marchantia polymorpha subsp. ruderalis]|eukprot:PTQ35276.1 hypothetical protein MARPO_0072s0032 [Marchantia polymorpha]